MVSVIIPNYNHSKYLEKRIESVFEQTYQDIEVILMDDCSTDTSRDIINKYKEHPKISHIVINDENSGSPFLQWQKGFQLVKGEIIWIAESDDYADRQFLEKLLPLFSNTVGLVYCDSNVIDLNDKLFPDFYKSFRNNRFKTLKWNSDYIKDGIAEIRENLFYECTINNMSATLFKKDLLQYVDWSFLKSFRYCGDWYFLVALATHTHIAYRHDALNYFKYGTDNFKKGTRSVLNYFRERLMVRYVFWKNLSTIFSAAEKNKLYKEMGTEMRIQLNEMMRGKSPFWGTVKLFKTLYQRNRQLFLHQMKSAVKGYV